MAVYDNPCQVATAFTATMMHEVASHQSMSITVALALDNRMRKAKIPVVPEGKTYKRTLSSIKPCVTSLYHDVLGVWPCDPYGSIEDHVDEFAATRTAPITNEQAKSFLALHGTHRLLIELADTACDDVNKAMRASKATEVSILTALGRALAFTTCFMIAVEPQEAVACWTRMKDCLEIR